MIHAERRAALVEKVAIAMCSDGEPCGCTTACEISTHYAIIALTVLEPLLRAEALEEAREIVLEKYLHLSTEHRLLLIDRAHKIASLMEKPNDPR